MNSYSYCSTLEKFWNFVIGIVIICIFLSATAWSITAAISVRGGLDAQDSHLDAQKSRCESLQGNYGGGKCFKGGKEI
nr:MAG TPA: hypothetical protein [Caudoviricetes sp.]